MKFGKTINSFWKLHESQQNWSTERAEGMIIHKWYPTIFDNFLAPIPPLFPKFHNQFYFFSVSWWAKSLRFWWEEVKSVSMRFPLVFPSTKHFRYYSGAVKMIPEGSLLMQVALSTVQIFQIIQNSLNLVLWIWKSFL